ncbi:MAG: AIR synthase-related protein [Candidatus Pacebacteria bacterium]|nr:AIR synthase-related protein [Candidatus Paceibacterota bacterium]
MYNPTKPYKHKILQLIESTWNTPYVKVERGLYPILQKKFSALEVQHTDGIGTKGLHHWQERTFRSAVIDSLAMNLNDLAMVGAIPYAIQNHIVLPKDDHGAILEIVKALAVECKKRKIAMTGGETSIHSDMHGMDISVTVSGLLKSVRQNQCKVGDVLIGLKSNGLHSNGMTKSSEVLGGKYRKEFTEPTRIYLDKILSLLKHCKVNGMMHITGGAFTKLKDILKGADAVIAGPKKLKPQKVFWDMYKKGVSNKTMYSTFNCGIGFILSVPEQEVKKVLSHLKDAKVIGQVIKGRGEVHITSAFDNKTFIL